VEADRLLVVNAGSSSLKLSLLDGDDLVADYDDLDDALGCAPDAVAHRIVHGGDRTGPVVIDDAVVAELESLAELAPLHQPPALGALARARAALPDVPHVACFDTAFHRSIPEPARTYARPERLRRRVRVFGFHGLSHAWASRQAREQVPGARRVVVAHLGAGASLCGVLDGRSVTTTMGFTPLDGLVMATRSGALDPGAVLWLAEHTDEDLGQVLESESGLRGLCGSSDMREVLARADDGDGDAVLARDVYLARLVSLLGATVATLGGLDVLVFTGGVGEHAPEIRNLVAARLFWLADPVPILVVPAREDLQMAAEIRGQTGG
jgi:acetate kinase